MLNIVPMNFVHAGNLPTQPPLSNCLLNKQFGDSNFSNTAFLDEGAYITILL